MLGYHLQCMLGYTPLWKPAARHAGIPPANHAGIHPPLDRITDACKNITLAQLRCGWYSSMYRCIDNFIIVGTSSLPRAIKNIQCLRQHDHVLGNPHHVLEHQSFTTSHLCSFEVLQLHTYVCIAH